MSAPAPVTRAVMLERDGHRCVSCLATTHLEAQHRAVVGMGGSKVRPLIAEVVTACTIHNELYEGIMQAEALRFGWKVPTWVRDRELTVDVPVFFRPERTWFQLSTDGRRKRISEFDAMVMMHAVYGDLYDDEKGLVA